MFVRFAKKRAEKASTVLPMNVRDLAVYRVSWTVSCAFCVDLGTMQHRLEGFDVDRLKEIGDYAVAIHAFRSGGREHSHQSHSVGGGVKRSSHCSEIERVNRCHDMLPKTSPVATNVTSPLPRVPITGSYLYVAAALS